MVAFYFLMLTSPIASHIFLGGLSLWEIPSTVLFWGIILLSGLVALCASTVVGELRALRRDLADLKKIETGPKVTKRRAKNLRRV